MITSAEDDDTRKCMMMMMVRACRRRGHMNEIIRSEEGTSDEAEARFEVCGHINHVLREAGESQRRGEGLDCRGSSANME